MKSSKKIGAGIALVGASVGSALADNAAVLTAAQTSFTQAGTDASTMGGYVITAVIAVVAIGILLSVTKKI